MKVSVTFFGEAPVSIAKAMIFSVRPVMDCPIVQLTDEKTEKLEWVDEVQRLPYEGDFGDFRLRHFMRVEGDVLHLDYDVIVNRDVSNIFEQDFDVALTRRPDNDPTASKNINRVSPHNMGVIFSRNPDFWSEVHTHYMAMPIKSWMWIQVATTEMAFHLKDRFKIVELPGDVYNFTPRTRTENVSDKAIVHYKGDRKHWMAEGGKKGGEIVLALAENSSDQLFYTNKHPLAKV